MNAFGELPLNNRLKILVSELNIFAFNFGPENIDIAYYSFKFRL